MKRKELLIAIIKNKGHCRTAGTYAICNKNRKPNTVVTKKCFITGVAGCYGWDGAYKLALSQYLKEIGPDEVIFEELL